MNREEAAARLMVARVVVAMGLLMALAAVVLYMLEGAGGLLIDDWVLHNVMGAYIGGIVAWLALPANPRNGALWTLVWVSLFGGLQTVGAALGLVVTGIPSSFIDSGSVTLIPSDLDLPGAIGFLLSQSMWVPSMFLLLTLGILLFPDGRPPSPRWHWVTRLSVVSITVFTLVLAWNARPWSRDPYFSANTDNEVQMMALLLVLVLSVLACLAGLVTRFRRSTGALRQQFRWVTWGFSIMAIATITLLPISTDVFRVVSLPAIAVIGVSYGIAISRYKLYEIDIVINRSLVFAVLAAFITGVYAVIVVGLGSWIGAGTANLGLSITATALVAVIFEPVRGRIQRFANRIVYGARATPYQVLADLTTRLASAESTEGLLERMAQRLSEGTGATRTALRLAGEETPAAIWPPGASAAPEDGEFTVPIGAADELLGSVSVLKGRGESLTPTEQALVEDLAGSARMVLSKIRLDADLAARAEDLRISRRRLVDAQAEERRRLERDLHDGAQQQVVALKVKLGLAQRFAEQEGSAKSAKLIRQMAEDAQNAIDEIRSLGKGIFPPLLESDGLKAAVSAGAANAPIPVVVEAADLQRYAPEVEAAAYFCITEAITNAIKYSGSERIDVRLRSSDRGLAFEVSDDGQGFDVAGAIAGSGIVGMRDRLEALGGTLDLSSSPGEGTRVEGFIPG